MTETKKVINNKRNFIFKQYCDNFILSAVVILLIFSSIMILSASTAKSTGNVLSLTLTLIKQVGFSFLSLIVLYWLMFNFDIKKVLKYSKLFYLIVLFMLISTRFFKSINGTHGWIVLPIPQIEITLQPAEFAKVFIIIFVALQAYKLSFLNNFNAKTMIKNLCYSCGLLFFVVLLLQKDFGSAFAMLPIFIACFLTIKEPKLSFYQNKLTLFLVIVIPLVLIFLLSPLSTKLFELLPKSSYQIQRFLVTHDPFKYRYGHGYQITKGLMNFASGGLFGLGYSKSTVKYTGFHAAQDDFILSVIVAEFGFLGYLLILSMYLVIIIRLFKYAQIIKANYARVIFIGCAMYLVVHFILNVGGVSGLIPLTGVPLILVSSGGSSMLAFLSIIGISQNLIIKYKKGEIA